MACKITHRLNDQQIRFANRDSAERYAEIMGGGVDNWEFTIVPVAEPRYASMVEPARVTRLQR
ncbi:hypothetical protein BAY61_00610 [Prauserella marina]|uniref:Uncharacterized protein n=1 Tax=Prauserella marina TaxID=530584 RepID=A0A222VJ04_9PSEU|nr:hypothetical protein [Prauserella marina]ASR33733.1 hypothetical protein BAY61_00610 [Prauserella marina]PWV82297.1 hypothetical protein DES30_102537 [Prauserella marina]SDC65602.1 hypothetical protein SAMN05421630_10373 [Prauserella marina]